MKSLGMICGSLALVLSMVAMASAVEPGTPVEKSSLANMGFGNLQTLSDEAGTAVRGKGFSFGGSWGGHVAGKSWSGSSFCAPRPVVCKPAPPVNCFGGFGGGFGHKSILR